jgi:hypothetical protein
MRHFATRRTLLPAAAAAAALTALIALAGCGTRVDTTAPRAGKPQRDLVTEPMWKVVEDINRNNTALPTLWARHTFEATVVDDKNKPHFVNGDGALLYKTPRGMRLAGTKPVVGTVFEIGSTEERFWLKLVPEVDTMWWGNYANVGKPCAGEIPIRPDLVFEVLGIATIGSDFTAPPVPTMRFNPESDVYMFVWNAPLADRWVAQREIWYDRQFKRPTKVLLFDENGRVVLRALLGGHRKVRVANTPQDRWPVVATDFALLFPDNGTKMSIRLDDVVLDKNGIPARRGISFPDPDRANVRTVIQIDKDCAD